jgi:PBP1b-binding outer membrane lipoprotein LpoB
MKKFCLFFVSVLALSILAGCASAPKVSRNSTDTSADLSGYWNAKDVKVVCDALINECINSPRVAQTLAQIQRDKKRNPLVIVGRFANESTEHLDTSIISKTLETSIFNSGLLDFVADSGNREDLRTERSDQDDWGSGETSGNDLDSELGADFMLSGTVKIVVDEAGGKSTRTYYVDANMTNIRTNARMWMGQQTTAKAIKRSKYKL